MFKLILHLLAMAIHEKSWLEKDTPEPRTSQTPADGTVASKPSLDGPHHRYYCEATYSSYCEILESALRDVIS